MIRKINLQIALLLIFSACFIWLTFLTQGLPIGDPDDWDHVLAATDLPWKTLLSNLITPGSKSTIWSGQINRMNEVLNQRLFRSIALKAVQCVFNFKSFPYYLFSKVLFFSGTLTLLFYLIFKLTRSYWIAFAACLFFTAVPAHYAHVLWLSDPDTIAQFWMILSLFFFLQVVGSLEEGKNKWTKALFFFFAAGWLAMKTKESALVLPLSVGTFSFFQLLKQRQYKKEFLLCLLICFFLAFLIIPVSGLFAANQPPASFKFETVTRLVFKNYTCGYDDESALAFFSLKQVWPVSIARTFGFYLLWTFVIFTFLYGIKSKFKIKPSDLHKKALIWICLLWILFWAFFVSSFQPDPRYFSGVMIPVTILAAYFSGLVINTWTGVVKIGLISLIVFALSSNVFENIQHIIFLRTQIGQRSNRFLNLAQIIFEDQYGPAKISEIGRYYSAEYIQNPNSQSRIKDRTYYVKMDYGLWNRSEHPNLEEFEVYAKKGYSYYVTLNKDPVNINNHVRLIKTISGINENSLFERLTYQLKRKTPQPLYVLKWTP